VEEDNGDSENFSYGKPATFKDVVIRQLQKVAELSCHELRGGYFATITDKKGTEKEIWIEDSRESYSNGIQTLGILLIPKYDKTMNEKYKKHQEQLLKLKNDFLEAASIDETEIMGEGFYESTKDKVLLEQYKIRKLQLFHELFSQLSMQLGRLNWMEIGSGGF